MFMAILPNGNKLKSDFTQSLSDQRKVRTEFTNWLLEVKIPKFAVCTKFRHFSSLSSWPTTRIFGFAIEKVWTFVSSNTSQLVWEAQKSSVFCIEFWVTSSTVRVWIIHSAFRIANQNLNLIKTWELARSADRARSIAKFEVSKSRARLCTDLYNERFCLLPQ